MTKKQKSEGLGVASLVLGILGIMFSITIILSLLGFILGILGIIFAIMQKRNNPTGTATGGLITSIVALVIGLILVLLTIAIPLLLFRTEPSIQQSTNCTYLGGVCSKDPTCGDVFYQYGTEYIPSTNFNCTDISEICCIKI